MVTEVCSGMVLGIEGTLVTIQSDISDGLPVFHMVGLLSSEVKEAKERVRTAFKNTGIRLPPKRISVNLAPADLRKRGTGFDLGIAVGLLIAMGLIPEEEASDFFYLGELALDGSICKVQGTLPILREAQRQGYHKCMIPEENLQEATLLSGLELYTFSSLLDVYDFFRGELARSENGEILPFLCDGKVKKTENNHRSRIDFSEIKGQKLAKRALMIGAAGFHNVFLDGPPGVGKSMLASAVSGILPEMTQEEIIDATMIYSVKGLLNEEVQWIGERPFRNPGHAITKIGLFGGGSDPKPGEISLAHHGVLFLDEFSEYKKDILEMLRIPLEEHQILLVRNERTISYPADFLLIAASNPCPCGYYPDLSLCHCGSNQISHYQNKLSGPILDRMDLFVRCERMDYRAITQEKEEETSGQIREKIMLAWELQKERFTGKKEYFNGRMSPQDINKYCKLSSADNRILERAFETYGMTGRGLNRVLKVARTIADLDGKEQIATEHLEEALLYRRSSRWER
ncbi:MAG: YifB family Mg chelatase-like AAA ATPase [Eubacteriales bacterium]|nr:YifB family Mg chelatase-like AAA ATPase [Eubacteriales bacterium]